MDSMSMEMIQNNLVDWLNDIVTGIKATQRFVQCVPTSEVEEHYRSYGRVSTESEHTVLLHGFDFAVNILQPKVFYGRRKFYIDYGHEEEYKHHPPYVKYFVYNHVVFFDYIYKESVENERKQNSNLGAFEELPVVDL